jgi:hypothetical protein
MEFYFINTRIGVVLLQSQRCQVLFQRPQAIRDLYGRVAAGDLAR